MTTHKRRASPLSPAERRKTIIDAVLPLLVEHGATVTTRQMAEAAGIAEGTMFRVFPDKRALIMEAIRVSMDPEPVLRDLSHIEPSAPLEVQLTEAGMILLERHEQLIALHSTLRTLPPSKSQRRATGPPQFVHESNEAVTAGLTELFERHRGRLRIDPARAASAFRALVFASAHPMLGGRERLTVREIIEVLTKGMVEPVPETAP